jgi:Ca2+-binding RTX toxin-like protein
MKSLVISCQSRALAISISLLCFSPLSLDAVSLGGEGAVIICPYLPEGLSEVPTCNGEKATCVGTDGHDLIWGTDASDVIVAGAGNDVIQGDSGHDTICGGEGNDAIHGARGEDTLFGEGGSDWLFGAMDDDTLYGGEGDFDVLWGGPGYDNLDGGPGAYDVCLKQRESGVANEETCETVHPPVGYNHDEEHELGTGVIGPR